MKSLFTILIFFPLLGTAQTKKVTLNLLIKGMPDSLLFYLADDKVTVDSAYSRNEQLVFTYSKKDKQPHALIVLTPDRKKGFYCWIENEPATFFRGSYKSTLPLSADNSLTQNEYLEYKSATQGVEDSLYRVNFLISGLRRKPDPDSTVYRDRQEQLTALLKQRNYQFLAAHPNSVISPPTLFSELANSTFSKAEALDIFNRFSAEIKNSPEGKQLKKSIGIYQSPQAGDDAPDFSMTDSSGKTVRLADLKGKNIVLIFWASWCGPCLAEIPYIKQAYASYGDKNIAWLAVSLDNNRSTWLKAIRSSGIPGVQVTDLLGWQNQAALLYGVHGIPTNVLIDTKGKIITRQLGFDGIYKRLPALSNGQ